MVEILPKHYIPIQFILITDISSILHAYYFINTINYSVLKNREIFYFLNFLSIIPPLIISVANIAGNIGIPVFCIGMVVSCPLVLCIVLVHLLL